MGHPDEKRSGDLLMHRLALASIIATSVLVVIIGAVWGVRLLTMRLSAMSRGQATQQTTVNALGGFPMPGDVAPDFKLINQFGQPVTLSSMRGHEVVLAFIDSRCTSLCPLTAEIMYYAKSHLAPSAANQVELVAINANPDATSINEVQSWSIKHGMLHQWLFLTGTAQQLQAVYKAYGIYDQVEPGGSVVHDPATYIIDAQGHERLYYETLSSNTSADLSSEELGLEAGMQQWLPKV
jgi:cytochrome oxidase Cu insertion factor (SCO1/SenC/PrrC family)